MPFIESLSKDFEGDDYKTHNSCMSEEQRYNCAGINHHRYEVLIKIHEFSDIAKKGEQGGIPQLDRYHLVVI